MSYKSNSILSRFLYAAHSCPFYHDEGYCAGGEYCAFPSGKKRMCCFWCPSFGFCPDADGICMRFKEVVNDIGHL